MESRMGAQEFNAVCEASSIALRVSCTDSDEPANPSIFYVLKATDCARSLLCITYTSSGAGDPTCKLSHQCEIEFFGRLTHIYMGCHRSCGRER